MMQTLIAVGLVGYLSYRSGQRATEELAHALIWEVSQRVYQTLEQQLSLAQKVNLMNLRAIESGLLSIEESATLGQHFWQQVQIYGFSSVNFATPTGEFVGAGYVNALPEITEIRQPNLHQMAVYEPDWKGHRLQRRAIVSPLSPTQTDWYAAAIAHQKPIWMLTQPWANAPTVLTISASAPAYGAEGQLLGVVGVDLKLSQISEFLGQISVGKTGQVFIMDPSGVLVASSTQVPTLTHHPDRVERRLAIASPDPVLSTVAQHLLDHPRPSLANHQRSEILTIQHQRFFLQEFALQDTSGLDWLIVVVLPEQDLMAEIYRNTSYTILWCGVTLLAALGLGVLTARWITQPILKLNAAASQLSRGQFDTHIYTVRTRELRQLSHSFSRMAQQLQASFQAISKSEQRLRQILEALPVGISVHRPDQSILYLNRTGYDLLGLDARSLPDDEAIMPPHRLYRAGTNTPYPPEDLPLTRALRGETLFLEDLELHLPDRKILLEVRAIPILNEQEEVLYALNTFQDITERRRAEVLVADYNRELQAEVAERTAALIKSEELFRRSFDDAAVGMGLLTLDGQWLKVNRVLSQITGYSASELLTMHFYDITYPDDLRADFTYVEQCLTGELQTYQREKRYIHKQGIVVWVMVNVSLVCSDMGEPLYFISQIQDISERRAIERMKTEFISIVSHELRTPLTAIRGALGLLQSGIYATNPDKTQRMIEIAAADSDRLVRLVNDILDLERLESGKVQLSMERCPVAPLMQQAVETLQAIAQDTQIQIILEPCEAQVWAAPDALIQTLTNLLSNAIKFSSPGSRVWLRAQANPVEAMVRFAVEDQGRGIPPENLESIFGQFQQVDVSDARKKGGTGLGLAICKNIVQQHGGRIWAESQLGQGSTFYFTLRLVLPEGKPTPTDAGREDNILKIVQCP